ncbi:MAG: hypothetical protein ACRDTG_06090 [Pseudonocardiaceae bacterium]
MSRPEWHIRSGQPADCALLASFACADPAVSWQVEVEQFIRTQLLEWSFDPHAVSGDPRLLLAFVRATRELFGVAAHERVVLQGGDGAQFHATKLEVLAIALPWQGRRFHTGERASDVLMSAVMTDVCARVPPRDARVFALVHEDNQRSIVLCHRHGLVEEMSRPHPDYRRIVTPHKPQVQDSDQS